MSRSYTKQEISNFRTNKKSDSLLLIPGGSADEKIHGISHFFEHLIISEIQHVNPVFHVNGFTKEDYMIISLNNGEIEKILSILKNMDLKRDEFEEQREILLREVEEKQSNEEETFFEEVWRNTKYAKTPAGNTIDIKTIGIRDISDLRYKIMAGPLFLYNKNSGLKQFNKHLHNVAPSKRKKTVDLIRGFKFAGTGYRVLFFEGEVEALFLIERILSIVNPEKLIQVSEKKTKSVLIIEKECEFPGYREIKEMIRKALKEIEKEINEIKEDFTEKALNELESIFFYNESWQNRIQRLYSYDNNYIYSIIDNLRDKYENA